MERMTAEEAYREYRKLEVYNADDVDREIKRLREALDAAEKVVALGEGLLSRLEALGGANCVDADEMALLRDALAEYDKLKEEK